MLQTESVQNKAAWSSGYCLQVVPVYRTSQTHVVLVCVHGSLAMLAGSNITPLLISVRLLLSRYLCIVRSRFLNSLAPSAQKQESPTRHASVKQHKRAG